MGRFSIFSWSSGKGSNSSAISRSGTLSRPQSIAALPQRKAGIPEETPSDELDAKPECLASDEGTTTRQQPESCPQLAGPSQDAEPDSTSSGGLEPLTMPPILGYSTRRFTGFKTFFRSRKQRRRRLDFKIAKDDDAEESSDNESSRSSNANSDGDPLTEEKQRNPLRGDIDDDETRKVSDATEKSVASSTTNVTVCHHPSKRMSMPITVIDRDLNPFDDIWETSRSATNVSNPFTGHTKSTDSTEQSSSRCSGSDNLFSSLPGQVFELSNSSHTSWSNPVLSGFNTWPTPADRSLATESFNKLACELYLEPLGANQDGTSQDDKAGDENLGDRLERRRDKFLGRIRTMRSSLQIREPSVPRARSLRRRKTFSALPARPTFMTSLQGKSLETLARLGGFSLLTLPGDFAPTTLSLPVCFVATINHLRSTIPPVPGLFIDPGDLDAATQTYHYFADQVLSAEREKARIHMTLRSSRMPKFLDNASEADMETHNSQVLGTAFAFRALLEGLPGGILGSMQLYRVLVNICHGRVSSRSVQQTGSCLAGLTAEDYAKVRAIGLAMLALTTSMQLNLMCGVFGLCSLLLHETRRMSELERRLPRRSNRRPSVNNTGRLSLDRLAATLGPLLAETDQGDSPDTYHAIQEEIESQRVATLLIENWRSVSRQLRIWERRGLEGRLEGRAASGESA
ncbi:uncharacterized protein BDV14DRAFT_132776 [Aspergillus stella-maris]|uniref:uncharacterized protein n=1 Tax=Aspergillus stella-maris TaxID=1810926 RepID=UPI003CCD3E45